jgi:methionyl-tRNA synthetase
MAFYITSPIYYVNDKPHIGHAYTTIICDVIARFMRLKGQDVKFMTGTDEHGQKIQRSAEQANLNPQEFVDSIAIKFKELADQINASHDVFLRTSEEHHKEVVLKVWSRLVESGNIYLGKYSGWYSTRDEAFYQEDELDENKLAPSGSPVEWVEEPCYFFALSKWQQPLLDLYTKNKDFIKPDYRLNEVLNFVQSGLKDLAVSRSGISWGIPVPSDKSQVIYVWLDALTSYLSAIDGLNNDSKFWPADVHVVGKDILRFHAVYWPAFLMALGMESPRHIIAHGWWINEGQKISKSLGNVIDPVGLINEFGVDYLRYFLIREVPLGNDGNFVREHLINRVNNELNNKIGNLCQRVLTFIYKQFDGVVEVSNVDEIYTQNELILNVSSLPKLFDEYMKNFAIHLILDAIINLADEANRYIDSSAPWKLIKQDKDKAKEILFVLVEVIRHMGIFLQPFIPESAAKILDGLGVKQEHRLFKHLTQEFALSPLKIVNAPNPIFNKIC